MSKRKSKKKAADFKKVQLKVGKVLKKQNVTDTKVATKKITIFEQTSGEARTEEQTVLSYCQQLGHHNGNQRRTALQSLKHCLAHKPGLIAQHLALIVRSIGRALCVADIVGSPPHAAMLQSIVWLVGQQVSVEQMSAQLSVLVAHLAVALSHHDTAVTNNALLALTTLLKKSGTGKGSINIVLCGAPVVSMVCTYIQKCSTNTKLSQRKQLLEFIVLFVDLTLLETNRESADAEKSTVCSVEVSLSELEKSSTESAFPAINLIQTSPFGTPFDLQVFGAQLRPPVTAAGRCSLLADPTLLTPFAQASVPLLHSIWLELTDGSAAFQSAAAGKSAKQRDVSSAADRLKLMLDVVQVLDKLTARVVACAWLSAAGSQQQQQQLRRLTLELFSAKRLSAFRAFGSGSSSGGGQLNNRIRQHIKSLLDNCSRCEAVK